MKSTIEFELPEDQDAFELACKAPDLAFVISDLNRYLNTVLKYGNLSEVEDKCYEKIRLKLWEILEEHEINTLLARH